MTQKRGKKKAVKHDYPLVRVTWADHYIDYGDLDIEDVKENVKKPYIGEFGGFMVAESQRMIAIANNVWEDGTVTDVMYIMKKAIIDNEEVEDD